jgi:hypothetical protein
MLRVEVHHDVQSMLTVELGGRQIPAHAEIDCLRAEVEKIARRLEAVAKRRKGEQGRMRQKCK